MEIEKYKEIIKWFNLNFPNEQFLKNSITDNFSKIYEKLPVEYVLEYAENPNFLLFNDSVETPEASIIWGL